MIRVVILFCISFSLANAHPGLSSETLKQLNLLNELAFLPISDPLAFLIKDLPMDLIPGIMDSLSFDQSYQISKALRADGEPANPLDRKIGNPLVHHDATSDNQAALKKWLSSAQSLKSHLFKLMENPTVDINGFLGRIVFHSANLGDLDLVKHLASMGARINKRVLRAACLSNNLDLVKFIVEEYRIAPNKYILLSAYNHGVNKNIIDYIVEKGNLIRNGWAIFGVYHRDRPIVTRNGVIRHFPN